MKPKSCGCTFDAQSRRLVSTVVARSGALYQLRRCYECERIYVHYEEPVVMAPIMSSPAAMTNYMLHESRT